MNYNNGMNFGYDQIFVNPMETHDRFGAGTIKRNPIEEDLIRKIQKLETIKSNEEIRSLPPLFADEAYTPKSLSLLNNEKEVLQRAIADLQRKNDMLIMFIVFLVVFVMLHNVPSHYGMYHGGMSNISGGQLVAGATQ